MGELVVSFGYNAKVVVGHAVPGSPLFVLPENFGWSVGVLLLEALLTLLGHCKHALHPLPLDGVSDLIRHGVRVGTRAG